MDNLEQEIREAFACQLALDEFDDDGHGQLKWKLSAMDEDSARKWLPLALLHEIRKAPTNEGDALVYFLDAAMTARGRVCSFSLNRTRGRG